MKHQQPSDQTSTLSHDYAVIITGPTAAGKTALAELIGERLPAEMLNADIGQSYVPLSVGTAKPDLAHLAMPHHLFDRFDQPQDFTVHNFRQAMQRAVHEVCMQGHVPLIVGGAQFYVQSLFFPVSELAQASPLEHPDLSALGDQELWDHLATIDPARARELHPHDRYRVARALEIWYATGEAPSRYKPKYSPSFHTLIIVVDPPDDVLRARMRERTRTMLPGWIVEVQKIIGTPWEAFVRKKGFIGYAEIIDWLATDQSKSSVEMLVETIVRQTWQYIRRQRIFWKKLQRNLTKNRNNSPFQCTIVVCRAATEPTASAIVDRIAYDRRNIAKRNAA